jgi:hypothetical protein
MSSLIDSRVTSSLLGYLKYFTQSEKYAWVNQRFGLKSETLELTSGIDFWGIDF